MWLARDNYQLHLHFVKAADDCPVLRWSSRSLGLRDFIKKTNGPKNNSPYRFDGGVTLIFQYSNRRLMQFRPHAAHTAVMPPPPAGADSFRPISKPKLRSIRISEAINAAFSSALRVTLTGSNNTGFHQVTLIQGVEGPETGFSRFSRGVAFKPGVHRDPGNGSSARATHDVDAGLLVGVVAFESAKAAAACTNVEAAARTTAFFSSRTCRQRSSSGASFL